MKKGKTTGSSKKGDATGAAASETTANFEHYGEKFNKIQKLLFWLALQFLFFGSGYFYGMYRWNRDYRNTANLTTNNYLATCIIPIFGMMLLFGVFYANQKNMLIATPVLFVLECLLLGAFVLTLIFVVSAKSSIEDATDGLCYQWYSFIDGSQLKNNCTLFSGSWKLFVIFIVCEIVLNCVSLGLVFASHMDIAYRIEVQGEKERLGFYKA
eukprot:TRINITY_DN5287_c0_g1_i3.p2 TRINITY_DN5287_c0_g1~~TRINITY_DN5287_c0_g1_i3.p2  ORF type:complete len:212 (+),score=55.85 TRINITY_DN5287_c0_g1_i3:75-710(+)